jgi:hypothetical protein
MTLPVNLSILAQFQSPEPVPYTDGCVIGVAFSLIRQNYHQNKFKGCGEAKNEMLFGHCALAGGHAGVPSRRLLHF